MQFPISFSIPTEKIIKNIPIKKKLLATCVPGDPKTYIFTNEQSYYEDYQNSIFAITKKKSGWDCMRHYEILANGCIPLFDELEKCPPNILTHLPKNILFDGYKLYLEIKDMQFDTIQKTYAQKYNEIIEKLLHYTHNFLSSTCMSKYILTTLNLQNINKILFLSGESNFGLSPDYLRCLTLHGFKQLFKKNCHDYPCISHLYTDYNENTNNLYGKGFSYAKLLDKNLYRNNEYDNTLLQDIINKKYDLIIYGSCHRGMPFLEIVLKIYQNDKNKVVFLCGEDTHVCNLGKYIIDEKYNIFIRELSS